MAAQTAPYPYTSPSSSLNGRTRKFDVFLSFRRGEDTCTTFTDHLYHALLQRGVFVYRDELQLERGHFISQGIYRAVEESRISTVIFSSNYARSKWCLVELPKIIECMERMRQIVFPVFYDVNPHEVRHQTGTFGNAFAEHEQVFGDNREIMPLWRNALTTVASISGFVVRDWYESEVISQIVKAVLNALHALSPRLAGFDSKVEEIHALLNLDSNDVRFIGIWGMGGIGKTTIAEGIFQKISAEFEVFTYVPSIREKSNTEGGLLQLQNYILSEALMRINIHITSVSEGATMIRNSLHNRKVLLILDDVDHLGQLESLAGNQNWFGLGSRVIITTRNEKLLRDHGVKNIFKVKELSDDESLQLFSYCAFKIDKPPGDYLDLSKLVVKYARGIPMALVVWGSLLKGRNVIAWKSELQRLKEISHTEVFDVVKISYDGLQNNEKRIFLDIACFFKGMDKERVEQILDCFGFNPRDGIQVLIEKSLITILNNKVLMNGLIQEMGQQLVHREYAGEPGKQSRLWILDDIIYVLNNNEAIEGIALDLPKPKAACWNSEAFSNMQNLRFLQIHNLQMTQGPEYLSNALKFLEWSGYPSKFLPQGFQHEELCELNLCHSSIEQLWRGTKSLGHLKFINVSYSQNLTRTPDFTVTPNLCRLILEGCTNLVEIHQSIGELKRLIFLNLEDCRSLGHLPDDLRTESLKVLILSGCSNIKKIPVFWSPMEHLSELFLDKTAIEELPTSIECLTGLTSLNLRDCRNLDGLTSNICKLRSLKSLNLSGCSKLGKLPQNLGKIDCLEELDACGTAISALPSSISRLENLKVLSLCGCKWMLRKRTRSLGLLLPNTDSGLRCLTLLNLSDCNLQEEKILENLGCLSSLVSLNLSKNNFVTLPKSIRQLSKLQNLNLGSCKSLQKLPDLSEKLNFSVGGEGSYSQERLSSCFSFINCSKVVDNQGCKNMAFAMLRRSVEGIQIDLKLYFLAVKFLSGSVIAVTGL
ncbi:unnamed protein product [Prunus brigantina]